MNVPSLWHHRSCHGPATVELHRENTVLLQSHLKWIEFWNNAWNRKRRLKLTSETSFPSSIATKVCTFVPAFSTTSRLKRSGWGNEEVEEKYGEEEGKEEEDLRRSPEERCWKPNFSLIFSHWVPFPEPGPPGLVGVKSTDSPIWVLSIYHWEPQK